MQAALKFQKSRRCPPQAAMKFWRLALRRNFKILARHGDRAVKFQAEISSRNSNSKFHVRSTEFKAQKFHRGDLEFYSLLNPQI